MIRKTDKSRENPRYLAEDGPKKEKLIYLAHLDSEYLVGSRDKSNDLQKYLRAAHA